ncbi:DUF115 domain-containing protein [Alphaproteobacteria bacterium]|nr:DUF115 domain-containing protein [Alphaproteobacteria bacterium]
MKLNKIELNEKLHQELIVVDELITKYAVSEDEKLTRDYIDQRRQLFAEYEQTLVALVSSDPEDKQVHTAIYRAAPELDEFVDLWCGQIRNLEFLPIYLSDAEYCKRFVDCYLPKSWNWETDFVMLINPFDETLLLELVGRGQKNVIILCTTTSKSFSENLRRKFTEFWEVSSLKELEQALWFYPQMVSNICHMDCLGQSEVDIDSKKINKIIKDSIYVRQINMNTIGKHSIKWATNTIKNIPNILKYKNINSVSLLNSKTGVVVSPGPSLEKNIHLLKGSSENLFIICPVRSVPVLRANGVEPDFVFQLDAIGGGFLENSKKFIGAPVKNLVVDATVDPGFFEFPAEKKFWYFSQSKTLGLEDHFDTGRLGLDAVSVSLTCLKFAHSFGLTKLILLGQDLAFTEGKLYSNGGELDFNTKADPTPRILVDGYYGGKVGTSADYEYFIGQFSELAHLMGDAGCEMLNCTEGGAFINNFNHVSLAQALSADRATDIKTVLENDDLTRDFRNAVKFCKKSKEQIIKVENFGRRALEIEKKAELSVDDVKNRDRYLRKMVKAADQSKILWWAYQDILMSAQQLTIRKEAVSDLNSFLEEILEITGLMIQNLNQTESALIAE